MNAVTIPARPDSRKPFHRPNLGDVLRNMGPDRAAVALERRYGIRRRHTALVAAMLGCGR